MSNSQKNDNKPVTKEEEDFIEAAKNGNIDLLRTYFRGNICHVDCTDKDGNTALIFACAKGFKDIFDLLVAHKCDVNIRNRHGSNAFFVACNHSRLEIIVCLINLGFDVNTETSNGYNALYMACESGRTEVVRILCNHQCKISSDTFFQACYSGYTEIFNLLLTAGFNPLSDGRQGSNYTIIACMRGHLKIAEALIACNCDITATNEGCDGETCLVMACRGNYVELVKLLLAHNCNVNARNESGRLGFTGLMHACRNGNVEMVKLLMEKDCALDVKCNNNGFTSLIYAVSSRNIEIINSLLNKGCDINAKANSGSTALMQACAATSMSGIVEVVKVLLANHCDIHIQNNKGLTALMMAFSNCGQYSIDPLTNQQSYEHMTISKLLLNAGGDYTKVCNGKAALDMINTPDAREEIQQFINFPPEIKKCYLRLPRLYHSMYHNKHTLTKTVGRRSWSAKCDVCRQYGSVYCCADCNIDVCVECIHKEESNAIVSTATSAVTEMFSKEMIEENEEDIADIKELLIKIGLSKKASKKYAEILVIKCEIGSETLFCRKLGSNMTQYVTTLNITNDEQELIRDYLSSRQNSNLSSPLENVSLPSSEGYYSAHSSSPRSPSSPSCAVIDWNELEYLEFIGRGAYSMVLKAKYRRCFVAVKILTVCTSSEALHKLAIDEIMTIHNAESKVHNRDTIVHAIGICQGVLPPILSNKFNINIAQGYGIVLQYEGGGSVESLLYPPSSTPKKLIPLQERIRLLMQIASGLDELHSAGILHGDIKPGNILLSEHTPPFARLADFGHAEVKEQDTNVDSVLFQTVSTHRKGTPIYTAPECLPSHSSATIARITRRTDIYSFAILAWEVLNKNNRRPLDQYKDDYTLIHNVAVLGNRPDLNELICDVPPAVRDMIQQCWDKDRAKRLSALQCYNTLELAYNILSQAKFDIFFSHPWKNKNVLRHVKKYLNSHGYRVWYDENDIGWDLSRSMQEGIESSQIVLVCLNKAYESSKNCMFELIESCKISKKIVTLVTEPEPFAWAGTNTTHGNAKDLCQLSTKMFIDIGRLCAKPGWPAENDPEDTPVPVELLDELRDKVADLIRLIQGDPLFCMPSL